MARDMDKYIEVRTTKDGKEYRVDGITLIGNMTNDCPPYREVDKADGTKELVVNSFVKKTSPDGKGKVVSIACNYDAPSADNKGWEKKVEFFTFNHWGPRSKYFASLKRGDRIYAKGYLKDDEYTRTVDGKTFTDVNKVLVIENFNILQRKNSKDTQPEEEMKVDGEDVPF